jgi:hypothetical protein
MTWTSRRLTVLPQHGLGWPGLPGSPVSRQGGTIEPEQTQTALVRMRAAVTNQHPEHRLTTSRDSS